MGPQHPGLKALTTQPVARLPLRYHPQGFPSSRLASCFAGLEVGGCCPAPSPQRSELHLASKLGANWGKWREKIHLVIEPHFPIGSQGGDSDPCLLGVFVGRIGAAIQLRVWWNSGPLHPEPKGAGTRSRDCPRASLGWCPVEAPPPPQLLCLWGWPAQAPSCSPPSCCCRGKEKVAARGHTAPTDGGRVQLGPLGRVGWAREPSAVLTPLPSPAAPTGATPAPSALSEPWSGPDTGILHSMAQLPRCL